MKRTKTRFFNVKASVSFVGRNGRKFKHNFDFPVGTRKEHVSKSSLLEMAFFNLKKYYPSGTDFFVYV